MTDAPQPLQPTRRWPGVLLSLLVPGFGLLRSGNHRRAFTWFFGIHLANLAVVIAIIFPVFPAIAVIATVATTTLLQIWMCVDSWKPGSMNPRLWLVFAAALILSFSLSIVTQSSYRMLKVTASAMHPTLLGSNPTHSPDRVVIDTLSYRFQPVRRSDLIIFNAPEIQFPSPQPTTPPRSQLFVMRVVGLPGETIQILDQKLYANGRLLDKNDGIPPLPYQMPGPAHGLLLHDWGGEDFTVGPDEYFVLGDNSPNSFDSRYWGNVPATAIHGKVSIIAYPFSRLRRVP